MTRFLLALALLAGPIRAADPPVGFQKERRVKKPTRLDWAFAAGPKAALPSAYDSRKQRYQLFVPATYKGARTWPLVVSVSSGDDPEGWDAWKKTCEGGDVLFAACYGAGGRVTAAQRIRAVLDVLDDIRRQYRIDPDRTYLAGLGSGAEVACRIAFALPEFFGGVAVIGGAAPLPALAHLRHRVKGRLSVALLAGARDPARRRVEKFLAPLYKDLLIRSRLWLIPDAGRAPPPAETALGVYRWLEDDLKRRRQDTTARGALAATDGEPASRVRLGKAALERAARVLRQDGRQYEGARLLEWVLARCGNTASATRAKEMRE